MKTIVTEYENRILKRKDVAEMFGVSLRTIDLMAEEGLLKKIVLPTRKRSIGFLESEIMKLINK